MTPTFFALNSTTTGTGGGGGGGSGVAVSDDFNRANSGTPGGSWTQATGNCDISSNTLLGVSGSYALNLVRHSTEMGSLTQYMKANMSGWGTDFAYIIFFFRWGATNSSPSYGVIISAQEDEVAWYRFSNTSGNSYSAIGSAQAISVNGGDAFGVTVDGTGTNTIVRVWRNCTGLPTAANNWNADTTPSLTFTTNPPTPVDSGTSLGVGLVCENSSGVYIDNWFGGSL